MTDVPQWRVRCLVWERCRNQRNCGILIAGGAGIKNWGFWFIGCRKGKIFWVLHVRPEKGVLK